MAKSIRKINTILSVPRISQLLPPPAKGSYLYFDGANEYPFIANTSQHSAQNAWWLAECSLLVYCEEAEIRSTFAELFHDKLFTLTWIDSAKTNTQGFALETADYVIIAFRGTEFPRPSTILKSPAELGDVAKDIKIDVKDLTPTRIDQGLPAFNTPVHPGFAAALQSVRQQLQPIIANTGNKPIWLTGHSLGGAIAHTFGLSNIRTNRRTLYLRQSLCRKHCIC